MPKTRRWFKRLGWAAAMLALLGAAVGWGLPALLESQLPPPSAKA